MKYITRHELSIDVAKITDPYALVIIDASVYRPDGADMPVLEVLFPGENEPLKIPFKPGEENIITSYHRNSLSRDMLPDGLYQLTYSVAPNNQVKTCFWYLRTDQLECELENWLTTVDWEDEDPCSVNYTKLNQLHALIFAGKANAKSGNTDKALAQFKLAATLLCTPSRN